MPSSRIPPGTTCIEDNNFMSFDGIEMYLIPLCSWRRAQQPPENRIGIRRAAVEESAIVTGALYRKTDPKIATAPKTQSRSKDQNDKDKFKVESTGKT